MDKIRCLVGSLRGKKGSFVDLLERTRNDRNEFPDEMSQQRHRDKSRPAIHGERGGGLGRNCEAAGGTAHS